MNYALLVLFEGTDNFWWKIDICLSIPGASSYYSQGVYNIVPGIKEMVIVVGSLPVSPGRVAQSVGHLTRKSGVLGSIPGLATYFRFSFRFLYARLKNGRIMLYPSASVRPSVRPSVRLSVRPSVNFFVSV